MQYKYKLNFSFKISSLYKQLEIMSVNASNIFGEMWSGDSDKEMYDKYMITITLLDKILKFIRKNLTMVIIVFNFLANLINLMIFTRPRFRKVSVGFYFAALAIVDIIGSFHVLYFYILYEYIIKNNLMLYEQSYYSFLVYFYSTVSFYSSWLSVLVAVDRCLSVISVKLIKILENRKIQVSAVVSLVVVLSLVNIEIWVYGIDLSYGSISYYKNEYPYVDLILSSILPFSLMCAFNITTVILLKKSKGKLKMRKSTTKKIENKENRFILTSIGLNVLFFISFLPLSITKVCKLYFLKKTYTINGLYWTLLYTMTVGIDDLMGYWKMIYFFAQGFLYYSLNPVYRTELNELVKRFASVFKCCK
jgi:hypothetical protein